MTDLKRAEMALTEIQHLAYDKSIELENAMKVPAGRLTSAELRQLAHKALGTLNAVNVIAEGGEPSPRFVAMLAKARREDGDPEEGTVLEVPEGCTGAVSVSPAGHPSVHHDGVTCPIHEGATAKGRGEELREQAGRVVEDHRTGESVYESIAALGEILDAFHAVRNGWQPETDEGWIGCEVECDDGVAFTVARMCGTERLILLGSEANGQGGCWEYADWVKVLRKADGEEI